MHESGKCHECFLHAGAFSHERMGIIVFCIVCTFSSTVLFVQFRYTMQNASAGVFHFITVYKQPLPYSYIDSTTVLSDIQWCIYMPQQTNLLTENASQNDTIFAQSLCGYRTNIYCGHANWSTMWIEYAYVLTYTASI